MLLANLSELMSGDMFDYLAGAFVEAGEFRLGVDLSVFKMLFARFLLSFLLDHLG